MIDLRGIARRFRLPAEQLRVAADLLEQGYQPGFIERYRADESGQLPNDVLWALKLEIDLQKRLEGVREKVKEQLPKDAELDQEAIDSLARATTEIEIDAALRCYRARRNLVQSQERTGQAGTLLEKLIAYEGPAISDLPQWVATELQVEATEAEQVVEQTKRLIGALVQCDTMLNEKLRRSVQRKAQIRVEFIDQDKKDAESDTAKKAADDTSSESSNEKKSADAATTATPEVAGASETETPAAATETTAQAANAPAESTAEVKAEEETSATATVTDTQTSTAAEPTAIAETPAEVSPTPDAAATTSEDVAGEATTADATTSEATTAEATNDGSATGESGASDSPSAKPEEVSAAQATTEAATPTADEAGSKKQVEAPKGTAEFAEFKGKKAAKQKAAKDDAAKKAPAKMTPRQRRRRWLIAMLQPMKSLKKPATKLTAYQQLMLGRGRRSQLVKTPLNYDKRPLFQLARDSFVADKHPLSAWFEGVVAETLENAWLAKVENDALADLEELAQEKLLENAADQLRANLSQRPIRGHVIMVVDTVGPKAASVAVVGPTGKVLATDEVSCSAHPSTIDQNVVRLGELAHKFKVTLVTLTNGPARRFLILTVRELMKQSASSGLRWTMADRGGAEAYAAGRIALRELSAHNRRDRAAIWIGRSLQDPLSQLLKVEQGRLRLGSYQRELPQEPLKKLVRETIADCVCSRGLDAHHASAEDLQYVPGIAEEQAMQISKLTNSNTLASRQHLLQSVTDWPEKQARQAIALLRIFESEEPLDGTAIHPDDYKLATRLIENTELSAPPSAPEGWKKPEPESEIQEQKVAPAPAAETAEPTATAEGAATTEASAEASESSAESPAAAEEAAPEVAIEVAEATKAAPAVESPAEATADAENTVETSEAAASVEAASPEAATAPDGAAPADAASPGESTAEEAGAGSEATAVATSEAPVDPETAGIKPEYSEDVVVSAKAGPPIDVEKLARGWQVGREKLKWVANCLNDPFADTRLAGSPVPMLSVMPTLETLEPGMCLWAVVVGVADFGAFVEIAPDCSGLIHISRLSVDYVEDPHQVVQVGDLLMTWVVSIDEKKNRVALTALSPAQVAANAAARREEREANARSSGGGAGNRGGQGGNRSQGGQRSSGGGGRTQDNRDGGKGGRGGPGQGGGRGGKPRGDHGGRGRGGHGGARRGGPSKPVVVKSKKPKAPISSAMKEGDEPLRSFSDLMQFYEAKRTDVPAPKVVEKTSTESSAPVAAEVAAPEQTAPEAAAPESVAAPEQVAPDAVAVDNSPSSPETPPSTSDTASDSGSQDSKVEN